MGNTVYGPNFCLVCAPYEEPLDPKLILDTAKLSLDESVETLLALLRSRGVIDRAR